MEEIRWTHLIKVRVDREEKDERLLLSRMRHAGDIPRWLKREFRAAVASC
jgi:hypothetical protein